MFISRKLTTFQLDILLPTGLSYRPPVSEPTRRPPRSAPPELVPAGRLEQRTGFEGAANCGLMLAADPAADYGESIRSWKSVFGISLGCI